MQHDITLRVVNPFSREILLGYIIQYNIFVNMLNILLFKHTMHEIGYRKVYVLEANWVSTALIFRSSDMYFVVGRIVMLNGPLVKQ